MTTKSGVSTSLLRDDASILQDIEDVCLHFGNESPPRFSHGLSLDAMMDLHTARKSRRMSYHSFLSNLDRLLRENDIRIRSGPSLPVAGSPTERSAAADPVVGRVQTFVDEHLAADLTLDRLADVADLSPSMLGRRFKAVADTTPWRYVMERRVEAAKRLLATTDRSLAEIAFDTGFYDQAHLTRTFKRFEGVTPGTYRADAEE